MTKQNAQRPTVCRICKVALPVASTGRVRYTCSDRCRQIRKRYGDGNTWREAVEYKQQRVAANQKIRKIEGRVGSLDIPLDPQFGDITLRERIRRHLMRGQQVTFCVECRMPYVADTWRKYKVCSKRCYKRHVKKINYLDDWCYDHMVRRTWWDRTLYIREHITDTICAHCGWSFANQNPKRKYCSETCKDAAYWKRRPLKKCGGCGVKYRGNFIGCSPTCDNRVLKQEGRKCVRCEKRIKPGAAILPDADTRMPKRSAPGRPIVFCSGRCRDRLGWSPQYKRCEHCHELYYPKLNLWQRRQRFCSEACSVTHYNHTKRERERAARAKRNCQHCGTMLPDERQRGHFIYCSDRCATESWREGDRKRNAEKRRERLMIPEHVVRRMREGSHAVLPHPANESG